MGKIGAFSLSITCVMSFLMTLLLPGGLVVSSAYILASIMAGYGFWWMMLPPGQNPSIAIPRKKAAERPPDRPKHVSWREIEEPLLYGWEVRFRNSIGPLPEGVTALKSLADDHMAYAREYQDHAHLALTSYRSDLHRNDMDKHFEHQKQATHFKSLYEYHVRKHYLLADSDPIELPMKYRLPEKGPSNRVHTA
jgi:hypothetical protein